MGRPVRACSKATNGPEPMITLCRVCKRMVTEHLARVDAEALPWPLVEADIDGWIGLYCPGPEWAEVKRRAAE